MEPGFVDGLNRAGNRSVEDIAREISERRSRGESPHLAEYSDLFPDLAGELADLFSGPGDDADKTTAPSDDTTKLHLSRVEFARSSPRLERLGEFRILGMIGRGGMGVVYQAQQESLGRKVALKVLPASALLTSEHVLRFKREAQAAARLHHTNIVPVHGVGEEQGVHFYVMQYIEGQGLDAIIAELRRSRDRRAALPGRSGEIDTETSNETGRLARRVETGRLTEPDRGLESQSASTFVDGPAEHHAARIDSPSTIKEPMAALNGPASNGTAPVSGHAHHTGKAFLQTVARIGEQVALALEYAHTQGVLHRDIKPSNLLLDSDGSTWITDFGLAKLSDCEDLTQSGSFVGTLRYMAPERFQGKGDERSEVYSLGLTLFELITLRPAFEAFDYDSLIRKVSQDEAPRLGTLAPDTPADLQTIIQKAIAREPERRYQTAGALAEDLRRFIEDRPILARRSTAAERLVRWSRRNPLLASLIAAVIVLGGALTVGSMVLAFRAAERAETGRRQLVRMNVAAATERMDEGDFLRALPRLGEALKLDQGDPAREEGHRYRLGSVLERTPRIIQLCPHDGIVTSASFSSDGGRIVTACADGRVRVWDLVSTEPIAPTIDHGDFVDYAEFNAQGTRVVTAGRDGSARVWDAGTAAPITPPLRHPGGVRFATFSPDGRRVATAGSDGNGRVWDAETGGPVTPPLVHSYRVSFIAFSPDGLLVATGSDDGTARVWDAATGAPRTPPLKQGHVVGRLGFSPDGKRLVTAGWDGTARVWDVASGKEATPPLRHDLVVFDACFSPDGTRIATASWDGTARIWDATTGEPLIAPLKHDGIVRTAVFSSDGKRLLTGSVDGTVRLWDAARGKLVIPPLRHNGPVWSARFAPGSRHLVTASEDGMARVWAPSEDRPVAPTLKLLGAVLHIALDRDGRRLATAIAAGGAGSGQVWDPATGKAITRPLKHSRSVGHVDLSPDGSRIITASWDGTARVWDAKSGEPVTPPLSHHTPVHHAAFSLDGRLVVTSAEDGTARIWDAATGNPVAPPLEHESNVRCAMFSPDGKYVVTASNDFTARIWSVAGGASVGPPLRHHGIVYFAAYSPEGRRVVTTSEDGTARIWDVATGKPASPPLVHQGSVVHAAFSPDGRRVATASSVGSAVVWDAATGAMLTPPLLHRGSVFHVAFSPDGRFVATAGFDGTARVWDSRNGAPVSLPLRHEGPVWRALFSPSGDWIATSGMDGTVRFWRLIEERRPVSHLVLLTELLSGQRTDSAGALVPLESQALVRVWKTLRSEYPLELGPGREQALEQVEH
jgi:eukaryotic-like serine/threonine-protein kinase